MAVKRSMELPSAAAEAELQTFMLLTNYPCRHLNRALDYFLDTDDDGMPVLAIVYEMRATSLYHVWVACNQGGPPIMKLGHEPDCALMA